MNREVRIMANVDHAQRNDVVLILAPAFQEAELTGKTLLTAGLESDQCQDVETLRRKIGERPIGAVLVSDEVFTPETLVQLRQTLAQAPPWSDLPIVILTTGSDSQPADERAGAITAIGNVTFLERPVRVQTLVTAIKAALRARRRQYEVRDLLGQHTRAVERVDLLAEVASHLLLSDQPEEIVAAVFRKIAAHLRLDAYLCYLYDERSQRLRLSSQAGLPDSTGTKWHWLDLNGSLCGSAARQRKRVLAEQLQLSDQAGLSEAAALGVKTYACFPLLANGRLIGTLSFGSRQRDRFEHEELAMLETISHQVAVAIHRKRTEEELQQFNQLLESRVEERTGQLREINDQMESFSYSISHDLRAPLRAIRGFSQALNEDYAASLDATGRDFLRRMGDSAERLDRLIQDLLQYSRVGRSTLTFESIDLAALFRRIIAQLDVEVRASHAQIDVAPDLVPVLAHEPTLEQVLINLLSNALKFVAPEMQPHIRIWTTDDSEQTRIWIADNGIGIPPCHHQRIFGVFERLHSNEAYPGTGIGLAIVAKGVNRLGGTVGVESTEGQGSRFWIELPKPSTGERTTPAQPEPANHPSAA